MEGVSARCRGLDTQLVTTAEAGIPNFSALELIGAADASGDVRQSVARLVEALSIVTPDLRRDPAEARDLWYAASGEPRGREADAIVDASLSRFLAPVRRDAEMWRPMWRYLHERDGDVVDEARFEAIFA